MLILKRLPTLFLQFVLTIIGIGVFAAMLWEPHVEGRNVSATLFEIYFKDPFLAYVYVSSIPFFVALYQSYRVLQYIQKGTAFSHQAIKALQVIQYCAVLLIAAIAGAEAYIWIAIRGTDDITGGVAMGVFAMGVSAVIGAAALVLEKLLQAGVDLKLKQNLPA